MCRAAPRGATVSLAGLPNTVFGVALGLAGNSCLVKSLVAPAFWGRKGRGALWGIWSLAVGVWVVLGACFAAKARFHRGLLLREWRSPRRCYYFFAPHLSLVALCIAAPTSIHRRWAPFLRGCYGASLSAQAGLCARTYARWVEAAEAPHAGAGVDHATPSYLLSTVGWPLLTTLGVDLDIPRHWAAPLPAMTFGPGVVFYGLCFVSILQAHEATKGEPGLFLLMAPPSAMVVALQRLDGGTCSPGAEATFGFALVVFLVILRVGPVFLRKPEILGAYWAYTFPLAALATAATTCATDDGESDGRAVPTALAWALSVAALAMLLSVATRMCIHARA